MINEGPRLNELIKFKLQDPIIRDESRWGKDECTVREVDTIKSQPLDQVDLSRRCFLALVNRLFK